MKKFIILAFFFALIDFSFAYVPKDSLFLNGGIMRKPSADFYLKSIPIDQKIENIKLKFEQPINYNILAGLGFVYLGTGVGVHIYQSKAFWDETTRFRFMNDWNYALWIDKIGHFYATNFLSHLFSAGLEAANLEFEKTIIYGALLGFSFEFYSEIMDGYGKNYGFSFGDLAADAAGAIYYTSQYYFPILKNFQPRWSYLPSEKLLKGQHKGGIIIDDYEGQSYWMSIRAKNLLPESIAEYWPSFLMLAIGKSVRHLDGMGGGTRNIFIAFDFDYETLPLKGPIWGFVKNTLSYFKFPFPGLKIYPKIKFQIFSY